MDNHDLSESETDLQPPKKVSAGVSATSSSSSSKVRTYKSNLLYDPSWKEKYPWMEYNSILKGMVCTVCEVFGIVPLQAKGVWVTRAVDNWTKAPERLKKHDESEWHLAALEKRMLSLSAEQHGSVMEKIAKTSEEEKKRIVN